MAARSAPAPFRIDIPPDEVADFRARLRAARWPREGGRRGHARAADDNGVGYDHGMSRQYLRALVDHAVGGGGGFDWPAVQRRLNAVPQFTAVVPNPRGHMHKDKVLHFAHLRAAAVPGQQQQQQQHQRRAGAVPLLLLHGWPSTPANFTAVIPRLAALGFDVVAPSIPGFGFSEAPEPTGGFDLPACADVYRSLMVDVLGYTDGFVVQGGDWGSAIGRWVATRYPRDVLAYHTNMPLAIPPYPAGGLLRDGPRWVGAVAWSAVSAAGRRLLLSKAEQDGLHATQSYFTRDNRYNLLQTVRPDTVGFGLNDSPLGLLSWIAEKYQRWTGVAHDEPPDAVVSMDQVLAIVLIFWHTRSITTSMRLYLEFNKFSAAARRRWRARGSPSGARLHEAPFVAVPTGVLVAHDILQWPRSWLAHSHNLVHLHDVRQRTPRVGHFPTVEAPKLFAAELEHFVFDVLGARQGGMAALRRGRDAALQQDQVCDMWKYARAAAD